MGDYAFESLPAVIALLAVCIASYTDLRRRIIPNKLTLPLVVVGIAFYVLLGIWRWDLWVAISGALGAAIAFAIGYILWLTGGWAGGDVKLFTALGALLPFYTAPHVANVPYPFPFTILLNSVIFMLLTLPIYAVVCCIRGKAMFYERIRITELHEGMIPAEMIYEKDGKVRRWSSRFGLKPKCDRVYANPRRAAGVTRYQVGALKRLVREGKLKNHIRIKRGVPFAPALGLGVFIAIFYGDLYWQLIRMISATMTAFLP
jgi:hypothetical protein